MSEVELLEQELIDMREEHLQAWKEYGSELCVADMINKEKELENLIELCKLKKN